MIEADPIAALRTWLLADAPIAELVGEDVFGGSLDGDILDRGPKAALVVTPSGGPSLTGRSNAEFDTARIDLIAYGATPAEADALMRTAAPRLWTIDRIVIGDTLIHWVNRAGGAGMARKSDTQWPQAFRSFQILYSLRPVA
ncbi:hypothetical protein [Sphingopyxis macrogoltabida]|uniref:DUF3168 domain-containing protein n=1 Tax=Sphingopyxis macrogoltabida TaxID=33050 RepID=A0AAC8Z2B2_SPHMC|nr:hypothetical protein [Sphingopyxis macrogoltabida]ALJ14266.1 hypothetical protein LH19_15455 [Sphingopyxis macrogoltabida]AMU90531.1 hypothetical protein ATM17_16025 [Sphingopyxis macrogoltabida]